MTDERARRLRQPGNWKPPDAFGCPSGTVGGELDEHPARRSATRSPKKIALTVRLTLLFWPVRHHRLGDGASRPDLTRTKIHVCT